MKSTSRVIGRSLACSYNGIMTHLASRSYQICKRATRTPSVSSWKDVGFPFSNLQFSRLSQSTRRAPRLFSTKSAKRNFECRVLNGIRVGMELSVVLLGVQGVWLKPSCAGGRNHLDKAVKCFCPPCAKLRHAYSCRNARFQHFQR